MIGSEVSLFIAFGAGFLSFLSPCILPLIPAYIMYITGCSNEYDIKNKKLFTLIRTIGFVIGFTLIFMVMGSSASFLGKIFIRNKDIFSKLSGIIISVFGLYLMGFINFKFLNIEKRISAPKNMNNWFSSILMGMAFAAGWTPCFGPVLGSILFYAGSSATVSKGTLLLLVYSVGMAVPFILTALFTDIFNKFLIRAGWFLKYIPKISGLVMFIFGILVFFNKVVVISNLFI
ncbi:cytochrome c biogenesis protein, transmembrane region, dsbD family [Gottschalkia acidurici 9a]|uniref:Cytochrome c biogenesis protein, transmembrane region, dsbD family n=1 Tax=Gottschalkia acidurici (strain ATCC 7906 / DSM 604 / BCRC 14475 / CIP 104303 / KCTC 5404 / NCIMB 10678 / 9a) TaxID=1128398 RepID=K0AXK4_GOTA9|nr:cytochrome c biogenesis protein CcdA [Gottschalkia acidurici]AFS77171.1 cytochrome c biogenesis protein, transmembrane region, dsbD family [Gottschalkia acidurici 9a]